MIITEERLEEIFSQTTAVILNPAVASRVPNFGWGNLKELNKYLTLNKDDSYPLIWLLPTRDNHKENGNLCEKTCEIIVATRETDISLFNDERYQLSFKLVLNPISDYIIEGFNSANSTRIIEQEWNIERHTNYSENEEESAVISLWDAIKITIQVEFNTHCINTIKWKT